jgi:hypothetical protein
MGVERERKSGMGWGRLGEAGRARSVPGMHPIQVTAPKCQENAAHKESSQKSHVQEQSLMAGSNCQAGRGNMAQHSFWARCGFYRTGSLRKLVYAR